jgi:hypothetical protein
MEDHMTTPDEEVAEKVLRHLREEKLLTENSIQKLGKSLAQGALSPGDWRLIFETDRVKKEDPDVNKSQQD